MAKRLIIAALFLILSFSVSFLSHIYFVNTSEKIISEIDSAVYSDEADGAEHIESLLSLWEKNKNYFAILLKHSDADTVDRYFLELSSLRENGDADSIFSLLTELKAFVRVTLDGEKPKIENIF